MLICSKTNFTGKTILLNNYGNKKDLSKNDNLARKYSSANIVKYPFNYNFCAGNIMFGAVKRSIRVDEEYQTILFTKLAEKLDKVNQGIKVAKTKGARNHPELGNIVENMHTYIGVLQQFADNDALGKLTDDQKNLVWEIVDHNDYSISSSGKKFARLLLKRGALVGEDFSQKIVDSMLSEQTFQNDYKLASSIQLVGDLIIHNVSINNFDKVLGSLQHENSVVRNCATKAIGQAAHKGVINEITPEDFYRIADDLDPINYEKEAYNIVRTIKELSGKEMIKEGYIKPEHLHLFERTLEKAKKTRNIILQDNMESIFSNLVKNNILTKSDDKYSITGIMQYT